MNAPSKFNLARRGARRLALTTALAVSSATLLTLGGLGLNAAHAQASAPDQRGGPSHEGCRHGDGRRGGPSEPGAEFGPFGHERMLDRMLDDVKATDAQRTQIKQITDAAKKDMQTLHEAGRGLHEKAMQALTAPKVDAAAAESLRQQMVAQHDKISKRALQAMLDISRVLTPEQRAQLAQRMKEHPPEQQQDHGPRDGQGGERGPRPTR
jgi:Spy/CpxP family protein refolding chaperone